MRCNIKLEQMDDGFIADIEQSLSKPRATPKDDPFSRSESSRVIRRINHRSQAAKFITASEVEIQPVLKAQEASPEIAEIFMGRLMDDIQSAAPADVTIPQRNIESA